MDNHQIVLGTMIKVSNLLIYLFLIIVCYIITNWFLMWNILKIKNIEILFLYHYIIYKNSKLLKRSTKILRIELLSEALKVNVIFEL